MDDEVEAVEASKTVKVPIVKAKGQFREVDYSRFNDAIYTQTISLGLKTALNGGATKLTAKEISDPEDLKKAAAALFDQRLAAMYDGTFKFGRSAKADSDRPYAVVVEATRRAKIAVKEWIQASGERVSTYKASAITEAAKNFLSTPDGDPIWKEAEAFIAAQKTPAKPAAFVLPKSDPELIAKAEKKAKVPAGVLSASKAGQVVSRAKH